MKFTEQILRETLRLHPPAQSVFRSISNGNIYFDEGFVLQNKGRVMINVLDIHRNKKYWKNPDLFDPERFTKENFKKQVPYQWIPFGGGPRHCIGNLFAITQVKVALSVIFRRFKVETAPNFYLRLGPNPLEPIGGIQLILKPFGGLKSLNLSKSTDLKKYIKHASQKFSKVKVVDEKMKKIQNQKSQPLLFLYGSNQGTSQEFAQKLSQESLKLNFVPTIMALDDYSVEKFAEKDHPLTFIICPSYVKNQHAKNS